MASHASTPKATLAAANRYRIAGVRFQRACQRLMLATFGHDESKVDVADKRRKRAEKIYVAARDRLMSVASRYGSKGES